MSNVIPVAMVLIFMVVLLGVIGYILPVLILALLSGSSLFIGHHRRHHR